MPGNIRKNQAMSFVTLRHRVTMSGVLRLGHWKMASLMPVWYALAYGVASATWSPPQTGVATEISVPSGRRGWWR